MKGLDSESISKLLDEIVVDFPDESEDEEEFITSDDEDITFNITEENSGTRPTFCFLLFSHF